MIDVQQIALAVRACTRQSLVIIDEFGKGTDSHGNSIEKTLNGDGAGLFCALLEHFLNLHDERPKVLMVSLTKSNSYTRQLIITVNSGVC
jgi:DNA mismatch repair protein MSH5